MKLTIEAVSNGFIVTDDYPVEQGHTTTVFEDAEDDCKALYSLLWYLVSILQPGSSYDRKRVEIKLVHGQDYECKDKDCKICKGEE